MHICYLSHAFFLIHVSSSVKFCGASAGFEPAKNPDSSSVTKLRSQLVHICHLLDKKTHPDVTEANFREIDIQGTQQRDSKGWIPISNTSVEAWVGVDNLNTVLISFSYTEIWNTKQANDSESSRRKDSHCRRPAAAQGDVRYVYAYCCYIPWAYWYLLSSDRTLTWKIDNGGDDLDKRIATSCKQTQMDTD